MRLHQINQQDEKYTLDESIASLYHKMINEAKYIAERISNDRPKIVVEKEIRDFISKYYESIPTIRTIVAFDKASMKSDPDRPSLIGLSKLINSDSEETTNELKHFKENVK